MSVIGRMCGFTLKERKKIVKIVEPWELLGLEPVIWVLKKGRFKWVGRIEYKDDSRLLVSYVIEIR